MTATYGAGNDYSSPNAQTETVTFNPYETSATVTYTLLTDTEVEAQETFDLTLALSGATAANNFATVISPSTTTVKINDCTGKNI